MQSEGWYTTANVLAEAADEIERLIDAMPKRISAKDMRKLKKDWTCPT
jgi:hypothetical protein